MYEKRLLTFVMLAMILAGCGAPGDATQPPDADQPPGEPPATSTTEPPPDVSPLEWLAQAAFEAGGDGQPDILPANLPEGFNAFEPEHGSAEAPAGFVVQKSSVTFQHLVGGRVAEGDDPRLGDLHYPVGRGLDQPAVSQFTVP